MRDPFIHPSNLQFSSDSARLSAGATPYFELCNAFTLPDAFISLKSIYEGRFSALNFRNYAIEQDEILTNETTMEIRYTKKVTDVSKFDSLFVKVLILLLADVLIGPLAGGDPRIQKKIDDALDILMPAARALDGQETNTAGRFESGTGTDARFQGRDPMR